MSSTVSYGGGYKPVSHQAPIVITARLAGRPPQKDNTRDMKKPCNRKSHPGMLAFVEKETAKWSVYPEPVYYTNVEGFGSDYKKFSFLGIVQTPGIVSGMDTYTGATDTNVVHAGGTMTTFNTGSQVIACNDFVYYDFDPAEKSNLPGAWKKFEGMKFPRTEKYTGVAGTETRIIGRAIRTSQPGQQLDLIMSF